MEPNNFLMYIVFFQNKNKGMFCLYFRKPFFVILNKKNKENMFGFQLKKKT